MMNWLQYLAEANIYLGVFYLFYYFLLNKETYYTLSRVYLLVTCVLAFVLPLVQIGVLKPVETMVQSTGVVLAKPVNNLIIQRNLAEAKHFILPDYLLTAYLAGAMVVLLFFIFKLHRLFKLINSKPQIIDNRYKLFYLNGTNTAFSFFNYLFIGADAQGIETILKHELVHVRQKHSYDVIFMELFKIVNWFNPLIYLVQNSLKTVHEYIADEQTADENDMLNYSAFLVNNAYGIGGLSITHSFFNYNLLKKRINMLHQKRSGSLARLKYLVILPVCAGAVCASTLGFSKSYCLVDLAPPPELTARAVPANSTRTDPPVHTKTVVIGTGTTSKGYKYEETGYLINNIADFRVIITEKDGAQKTYFRNSATAGQIKLLKAKYGYTFPTMSIFPKMPPPPPAPPVPGTSPAKPYKALNNKLPPPVVMTADISADKIKTPAPPLPPSTPPAAIKGNITPPPAPVSPVDSLCKYIARYTRYPAKARENRIAGRVIVTFDLNGGKIANAKITRGLDPVMDGEVIRVINNYTGPVNLKDATYNIPVAFVIQDKNGKKIGSTPANKAGQSDSPDLKTRPQATSYTLDEVVITTYL